MGYFLPLRWILAGFAVVLVGGFLVSQFTDTKSPQDDRVYIGTDKDGNTNLVNGRGQPIDQNTYTPPSPTASPSPTEDPREVYNRNAPVSKDFVKFWWSTTPEKYQAVEECAKYLSDRSSYATKFSASVEENNKIYASSPRYQYHMTLSEISAGLQYVCVTNPYTYPSK